ncbi:Small subunit of serine palmitoyltransferase-like protein [Rutstroemia sp. NJR-2017a BBW]|nr:Small subunit of serine palmitoyltransferase-like protein [Rutstroemia sp. NJR-2017a BBW]
MAAEEEIPVTFSLYMLTPTEKFIFNSFLFLFFSMIVIAMTLYLPQHITFLTNRAWFYYNGDESARSVLTSASPVVVETVKETIVKAAANGKEL